MGRIEAGDRSETNGETDAVQTRYFHGSETQHPIGKVLYGRGHVDPLVEDFLSESRPLDKKSRTCPLFMSGTPEDVTKSGMPHLTYYIHVLSRWVQLKGTTISG
jgi:hypothetical protein